MAWAALIALALVWWLPSILLALTRWQAGRLRFEVVMGLGRALAALGRPEVASRLYGAEAARAERGLRAIRAGRPL